MQLGMNGTVGIVMNGGWPVGLRAPRIFTCVLRIVRIFHRAGAHRGKPRDSEDDNRPPHTPRSLHRCDFWSSTSGQGRRVVALTSPWFSFHHWAFVEGGGGNDADIAGGFPLAEDGFEKAVVNGEAQLLHAELELAEVIATAGRRVGDGFELVSVEVGEGHGVTLAGRRMFKEGLDQEIRSMENEQPTKPDDHTCSAIG